MCRIASLFLLRVLVVLRTEAERSMSGEARDFNNIETRAVIKFYFLQGKAPKEIQAILAETLVKNWVAQYKRGDFFHLYLRNYDVRMKCLKEVFKSSNIQSLLTCKKSTSQLPSN